MNQNLSGVLLAGGKSSRMGRDKGLLPFGNGTFASHALALLKELTVSQCIITSNPAYQGFGLPVYPDLISNKGPAGGIYTALTHAKTQFILVLPVDMPFMNLRMLTFLSQQVPFAEHSDAIIPLFHGEPQPLVGIYSREALDEFRSAVSRNDLKMQHLLSLMRTRLVPIEPGIEEYAPNLFANVNTPYDLEQMMGDFDGGQPDWD